MKIPKIFSIFIGVAFLFNVASYGATINVPDDYPTIQGAIDAAVNGDIVEVGDGTYKGIGNRNIDINGKDIIVRSINGAKDTIIDCESMGRGFYLHSDGTDNVEIRGFTITNGFADGGAGIYIDNSTVMIADCKIIGNRSHEWFSGGGILNSGTTIIIFCTISDNEAYFGAGVLNGLNLQITNCSIFNNASVVQGGIWNGENLTIENSTVYGNQESGIHNYWDGTLHIKNTTVSGHIGPGIFNEDDSEGSSGYVTIENSIIAGNGANEITSISYMASSIGHNLFGSNIGAEPELQPTDYVGDPRLGQFKNNPSPGNSYLPLLPDSPAIDKGNDDNCPPSDQIENPRADGDGDDNIISDIGAIEFQGIVIDTIDYNGCISELCTTTLEVSAHDMAGSELIYEWDEFGDGTVDGTGDSFLFDPPGPSSLPDCAPYFIKLTVTSSASGLSIEEFVSITVKLAGDANGDGVVNILDKVMVRNAFGQSGDNPADVNCDGVVNILDKVIVRNQFGQSGCACP